MSTRRRAQRALCDQCGAKVTVLDGGTLKAHYPGGKLLWPSQKHCPGGAAAPGPGLIRPVVDEPPTPPALIDSERSVSVRTVRGGLPSLGR